MTVMTFTPPTTCAKTDGFEAYTARAQGEWATIIIRGWQSTGNDGKPHEIGEILIHSSFGSWAYQWGHLGLPFREWLPKAERAYCAEKFLGTKAYQFDGATSVRELRRHLLQYRRDGSLGKGDARELWDWIDDNECELETSENDFVWALERADTEIVATDQVRHFLSEPWEYLHETLNRSFARFWEVLWPVFVAQLKAEAA